MKWTYRLTRVEEGVAFEYTYIDKELYRMVVMSRVYTKLHTHLVKPKCKNGHVQIMGRYCEVDNRPSLDHTSPPFVSRGRPIPKDLWRRVHTRAACDKPEMRVVGLGLSIMVHVGTVHEMPTTETARSMVTQKWINKEILRGVHQVEWAGGIGLI